MFLCRASDGETGADIVRRQTIALVDGRRKNSYSRVVIGAVSPPSAKLNAALKRAFDKIPDIDVMFYCAGTSLAAPVADAERNDYKNLFDVNLVGAVDCCKLALGKMRHGGKIVLLSSVGAVVPISYDSFYSASKAGMCMFARALDLENKNIDCTAAIIGGVRTQFSFKRKFTKARKN